MRKFLPLAVRLLVLAGVVAVAAAAPGARADGVCPNLCCNASCIGVYECHHTPEGCVCTPYCVLLPPNAH